MTPELTPLALPADDAWQPWLAERTEGALRRAAVLREELAAAGPERALDVWNRLNTELAGVFAVASLLAQVHPDPALRERAEAVEVEANKFRSELMLDARAQAALAGVDPATPDAGGRRVLAHALRDFRRAGVDRDQATRARLRELDEQLVELGQTFSRGIREGSRTTEVPEAALAGLPADWVAAHPASEGTVTLSTDYPDTVPFLSFAHDAAARRAVTESFLNVGWPDNDAVLGELLRVRHEYAQLLGYDDWPSYDAAVKMIGSGPAIGEFIDSIAEAAKAAGERDLATLLERARRDEPELAAIDVSNWRYWTEVVRREQFDVDAQQVRAYFDFTKVRDGLLEVTGRLFGLTWTPVPRRPPGMTK